MKIGDSVVVTASREDLDEMGIFTSHNFLLDGKAKKIHDICEDLVYLAPRETVILWVYKKFLRPADEA